MAMVDLHRTRNMRDVIGLDDDEMDILGRSLKGYVTEVTSRMEFAERMGLPDDAAEHADLLRTVLALALKLGVVVPGGTASFADGPVCGS